METTQDRKSITEAIALFDARNYSDCKLVCKHILAEAPDDFEANFILGYAAYMQHQFGVAKKYLARACDLQNENSEALNVYACTLNQLNEKLAAEVVFAKAIQYDRNNAHAYINMGMLKLESDQPEAAQDLFFSALKLQPGNSLVYLGLAQVHRMKNILAIALQYIEIALELNPELEQAIEEKNLILHNMHSHDAQKLA